jgi:hypothetical protein
MFVTFNNSAGILVPVRLAKTPETDHVFPMHRVLGLTDNPEALLSAHKGSLDLLQFDYLHDQSYIDQPALLLTVIYEDQHQRCVMAPHGDYQFEDMSLDAISDKMNLPVLDFRTAIALAAHPVEKPWGKEIWYTGIEQRGVCTMGGVPIPWVLDCFGQLLSGSHYAPPILLKILEPLAQDVIGDLYFEAHAHKTEVYIVTAIDKDAWPDGIGKIRFGFDDSKKGQFPKTEAFAKAYLQAVEAYREVRSTIDQSDQADQKLRSREVELRAEMESFTSLRDLRVGDVVQVPPLTPHSLLHGVTVVEFQTPHYERYILSFAQKVLTQDHWDTETALPLLNFATDIPLCTIANDIIANFEDFSVTRKKLAPGESLAVEGQRYGIVMPIIGEVTLANTTAVSGSAFYLPACSDCIIRNEGSTDSMVLLAMPSQEGNRL